MYHKDHQRNKPLLQEGNNRFLKGLSEYLELSHFVLVTPIVTEEWETLF